MSNLKIQKYLKITHKFGVAYILLYTNNFFIENLSNDTFEMLEKKFKPILVYEGYFINNVFETYYRELIEKRINTHIYDMALQRKYSKNKNEYVIHSQNYMRIFEENYVLDEGRMTCFEDIICIHKIEMRELEDIHCESNLEIG